MNLQAAVNLHLISDMCQIITVGQSNSIDLPVNNKPNQFFVTSKNESVCMHNFITTKAIRSQQQVPRKHAVCLIITI
jgi:hypothetical protein